MKEYTISCGKQKYKEVAETGIKPDFEGLVSEIDGMTLVKVSGRGRYAEVRATEDALKVFDKLHSEDYIWCEDVPLDFPGKRSAALELLMRQRG